MKLFLVLICIILKVACFAQVIENKFYVKYSTDNYTIHYPSSWKIDTSRLSKMEFSIFSPKENEYDKFSENINLIVQELKGQNIDLEKYEQLSNTQIKINAKDLMNFKSVKITTDLGEYYLVNFEMSYANFKIHTEQYYFIKNEKGYVLTFSAEFEKDKSIGENILKSFTIIK